MARSWARADSFSRQMGLLETCLISLGHLVQLPRLEATLTELTELTELTQLCDSRGRSAGMLASIDSGSMKLAVVRVGMGPEVLRDLHDRVAVCHVPGHVPTGLLGTH